MRPRFSPRMVLWFSLLASATAAGFAVRHFIVVGVQPNGVILVPTGQALTPAGAHIEVNDRPLGMVLSPAGNLLAVVTGSNFNPRALHLIDVNAKALLQTIPIANSFVGIAFSPAGDRIYVGGGASNDVKIFSATPNGLFAPDGSSPMSDTGPTGLALTAGGERLHVALNLLNGVAGVCTAPRADLGPRPLPR